MPELTNKAVVITGGNRGLGRGIVEALVARGARVTVVARDAASLAAVASLGVSIRAGDASDAAVMDAVVRDVKPDVLILNAGATPILGTLDELDWKAFSTVWDTDVKAGLHGIQAALKAPMPAGGRVLIASSGAAMVGATLSGSYAGAKRMLWFMADDANDLAQERGLDIRFQALVPLQMIGDTAIVREVCDAYGRHQGIGGAAYRAQKIPVPMSERAYGDYVTDLLSDQQYAGGIAYGFKMGTGITSLDR
jgi:NAD(P)-dependent dehydrogenase (short-subunit alcohol dehydrogenase family)